MEQTDKLTESLHSLYADVEAKLAPIGADKRVVFYIIARHGTHSAVFGGRAGIAVSTIREAPSVRILFSACCSPTIVSTGAGTTATGLPRTR
jgi:hypothetical protein